MSMGLESSASAVRNFLDDMGRIGRSSKDVAYGDLVPTIGKAGGLVR